MIHTVYLSTSSVRHFTKCSPSISCDIHSQWWEISRKTKHSQTVSTSANILHEFLICCYDPTLQFLIRTAKWLLQNSLHGSDLTHKSNLMLICYLLVMSCCRFHFFQIVSTVSSISTTYWQQVWIVSSSTLSTAFSSHLTLIHKCFVEIYTLKCLFSVSNWPFFDQSTLCPLLEKSPFCPDVPWVSMIVVHWSQQPA